MVLWMVRTPIQPGFYWHLSGMVSLTLIFGWSLALIAGAVVSLIIWQTKSSSTQEVLDPDALEESRGLADAGDLLLVAPATANIIGKMANGIADDFLSTELMVVRCPVVVAPATTSRTASVVAPPASATSAARWMTGPSISGSE